MLTCLPLTRVEPDDGNADHRPAQDIYGHDFYAWSRRQAELLRARRFSDLDLANLAEEVEDLGETVYRSVRSRVRTTVEHLLKLEHSAADELKRAWRETIRTQRADLDEDLTAALRPRIEAGLPRYYDKGRRDAAAALRDYGEPAAANALPPKLSVRSRADHGRVAAVSLAGGAQANIGSGGKSPPSRPCVSA